MAAKRKQTPFNFIPLIGTVLGIMITAGTLFMGWGSFKERAEATEGRVDKVEINQEKHDVRIQSFAIQQTATQKDIESLDEKVERLGERVDRKGDAIISALESMKEEKPKRRGFFR